MKLSFAGKSQTNVYKSTSKHKEASGDAACVHL
jgi:hypothetical protein